MISPERREKNRLYNIAYRERHREKVRAANAAWQAANPDCNAAKAGIHRARKLGCPTAQGGTPEFEKMRAIYRSALELTARTGVIHHVDHIVPLSRGGAHEPDNLQILTADEHKAKTREERGVQHDAASV